MKRRSPINIYVHSRRGCDIDQTRTNFEQGLATDPAPYGFDEAEEADVHVSYSRDKPHSRLSLIIFQKLNLDLLLAVHNLPAIRVADVIWTVLEWEWMAVALLQRLHLAPKRTIVANSVWFAELWLLHAPIKRKLYRWLMMPHVILTLHSERARQHLAKHLPEKKFEVSYFGISNKAWPLTTPRDSDGAGQPLRIYSIGNDRTRDWETLLEAFGNDPRFAVTIVCKWLDPQLKARYPDLRTPMAQTIKEQIHLYEQADLVVIAMKENTYSGITVALEAACLGVPILCSATGGVDTYFSSDEVLYVPPEDPVALREAVLTCTPRQLKNLAERAQRRFVQSGYRASDMARRYLELSNSALEAAPDIRTK